MKRLALTDVDYKSEMLDCNATDLSQEVYYKLSNDKDTIKDILFGNGDSFMSFVQSNFLQSYIDDYTMNNTEYNSGDLNAEIEIMKKAIYNNICNKIEAMYVKDLLQYIGIQLVRK